MTDTDLTSTINQLKADLGGYEAVIVQTKTRIDYLKSQIKEFEKEQKRREKWAEKTNGKAE